VQESGVSIINHCFHTREPPVPASVVKKLVTYNPSLLQTRRNGVRDPYSVSKLHGLSLLHVYIWAPSWVLDTWETNFEVCKVLIEAEPKLLFYKDKVDDSGKDSLLQRYEEEAKSFLESFEKLVDLKAVEEEADADQKKWVESLDSRMKEIWFAEEDFCGDY